MRPTQKPDLDLAQKLRDRTAQLAASALALRRETARRATTERDLKRSERHYKESLEKSARLQEQLRRLSHQILCTQEEERKRISRELHDQVTATLTGINIELNALEAEVVGTNKRLKEKILTTQQLVQESVESIHRFARELRPATLDDLGLIPALHSFTKALSKQTGLQIDLTVFRAVEELDNARRTVLYRVVQEALTNVAKHAKASHVTVNIAKNRELVKLTVEDDGKGFHPARLLNSRDPKRLGLLGMRERTEMVGGSFTVKSTRGAGATIEAIIPAAASRKPGKQALFPNC